MVMVWFLNEKQAGERVHRRTNPPPDQAQTAGSYRSDCGLRIADCGLKNQEIPLPRRSSACLGIRNPQSAIRNREVRCLRRG